MAILGALAARRSGKPTEADRFLDEALVGTPSFAAWPAPVALYLKRELSAQSLLDSVSNDREATEARAFLGFDRLTAGDRPSALEHLRWVRDHGLRESIAHDLARATLDRLE
jgi:hypothetical protein